MATDQIIVEWIGIVPCNSVWYHYVLSRTLYSTWILQKRKTQKQETELEDVEKRRGNRKEDHDDEPDPTAQEIRKSNQRENERPLPAYFQETPK